MKRYTSLILLMLVAACCSMPAMGAIKYFGGSPQMTAYVTGVSEFTPGDDATITVMIQNSGTSVMKFTNSGILQPDDLPTTAKQLTAGLSADGAPIIIKTDPQMAGDLASPNTVTLRFNAKILSNATIGEYQIPLTLRYKYLKVQDQEAADTLQFLYNDVTGTLPVTIKIKTQVKIAVLEAVPENLNAGTEGYLNLTIKNIGSEAGKKATVKIIRNDNSPVIPTDSSVFVGDFPQDGVINCRYKVAVSNDAEQQTYPVDVAVTYENTEGDQVTSSPETLGVPVGGKISFAVISPPATVYPGETTVIEVVYQNNGTSTAYNAQARLNAVQPFSSADNSAFLGNIQPGGHATARYALSSDRLANLSAYELDTEIRYRDSLDNSQVSDIFKTDIKVVARPAYGPALPMVAAIVAIAAILAGAGYYILVKRKKQ
jgi:hypothetical protein